MDVMRASLDDSRMTAWMHADPAFDRVLHIAHRDWHGIRQATAYVPGHKLLIPAGGGLDEADFEAIERQVSELGITRAVFQGYSNQADALALRLAATCGPDLRLYAITHVTPAQFDNYFEMEMLRHDPASRLRQAPLRRDDRGVLAGHDPQLRAKPAARRAARTARAGHGAPAPRCRLAQEHVHERACRAGLRPGG